MPSAHASPPSLSLIGQKLARTLGLHFPPERWHDLWRGLSGAGRELQIPDTLHFVEHLLASPLDRPMIECLARHLTIGETYFFREQALFDALQSHVLPELIARRRACGKRLRLWSAGCATGEEAYSLAILLHRMLPDAADWQLAILATDIHPEALRQAEEAVYTEWSFRNTPDWLRPQYFTNIAPGRYRLNDRIRKTVRFAHLNLAEDHYPGAATDTLAMDLIVCRNVLMYFDPDVAFDVVQRHYQALEPEGWLVVGPTEISSRAFARFTTVHLPGAILHRKPPPAAELAPPRPTTPLPSTAPVPPASRETASVSALQAYRAGRYRDVVLQLSPPDTPQEMALLAHAHANLGNLDTALQWSGRALATKRLDPKAHYLHGLILQELGRAGEAMRAFRQALFLDHGFVMAHFAMGRLLHDSGKRRSAEKHFIAALECLKPLAHETPIPESDGMTAGRLSEIVMRVIREEDKAA